VLKYIFSALLIVAVWLCAILLDLPYKYPIAVVATIIILGVLATVVIVRVVRAKKAAREIERALRAQADAHAASARPDLKADIDAMQHEFLKAVQALKSSKLGGKKGAEALYALPWYMIIGPPGSGKSTALRNSGLRFPYMSKSGGAVQGVGGTRNCQWWMTNEAVILDTAGRYTTEDSDRDEWLAFLDLLRRNRPKQPVNGILVAIPVSDLSDAHPEEVLARAREVRARIDEVMNKLETLTPVYVLFTKCDLLPGFVEIFADLGATERNQIWGFTVPVTAKRDPAQQFSEHFTELCQIVERRALRRLAQERSIEARDKIFAFPQYFEPLHRNLAVFVGELMAESIYTESPIFRGAYFTSGTQEGRPIDRIMNSMAEAFGVQPKMQMFAPQVEGKSYFLGDVFQKVIFPDKNVASRSMAWQRRQARTGHAIAAGLFVLGIGMAALPVMSFRENRDLLIQTREAVQTVEEHPVDSVDPIPLEKIDQLREVERVFNEHGDDGVPLVMRMGMYQSKKYDDRVHRLYVKTLREQVIAPLHALETDMLKKFVQRYAAISDEPKHDEQAENRDRLHMYLLLTGPYQPGEPGLTAEQQAWLAEMVTKVWNDRLDKLKLTRDVNKMRAIVSAYVDRLAADKGLGLLFERDPNLVKNVRKILNRKDRTKALLNELLSGVEVADLQLHEVTASLVALKSDQPTVPGRYTRPAWEGGIRELLDNPFDSLSGDEWVLGLSENDAKASREQTILELKSLYFDEYTAAWSSFLGGIYVAMPPDYVSALSLLEDLTRGSEPPFKRLAHYVYYHTDLPDAPVEEEEDESLKDALLEKGKAAAKKRSRAVSTGLRLAEGLGSREAQEKNPLLKMKESVRTRFEKLAAFGFAPPPPPAAEGAPTPPPPPVPLDTYHEELKRVRDAVRAQINIGGDDEKRAVQTSVTAAIRTTEGLINDTDTQGWRPTLQRWLLPPLEALRKLSGTSIGEAMVKSYCEQVYNPLTRDVFSKYPFVTEGRDLKVSEFAAIFKPSTGKLWSYYNGHLVTRYPRQHGTYALNETGVQDLKFNPKVVDFLNRAQDLTESMFPTGRDGLLVEFDVWIEDNPAAAITTLQVGEQVIEHRNGPGRWQRMTWAGDSPKGASIKTRGNLVRGGVEREGEWGLFELLEVATVRGSAATDVFVVQWDLRDQDAGIVTVKIRPTEENTPFFGVRERGTDFMGVFRSAQLLRPPTQLILGLTPCGNTR